MACIFSLITDESLSIKNVIKRIEKLAKNILPSILNIESNRVVKEVIGSKEIMSSDLIWLSIPYDNKYSFVL